MYENFVNIWRNHYKKLRKHNFALRYQDFHYTHTVPIIYFNTIIKWNPQKQTNRCFSVRIMTFWDFQHIYTSIRSVSKDVEVGIFYSI